MEANQQTSQSPAIPSSIALVTALAAAGTAAGLSFSTLSNYAVIAWCLSALLLATGVALRSPRIGTLVSALVCFGSSLYLFLLKIIPNPEGAFCSVSETIDCVDVNNSSYSVVFTDTAFQMPITLPGMAFFAGLAVAALLGGRAAPKLFQVSGLFALFNVAVSIYLLTALVSEQKICVFCITIYLGNGIILACALAGLSKAKQSLFGSFNEVWQSRTLLTIVAMTTAGIVGGRFAMANLEEAKPIIDENTDLSSIDVDYIKTLYGPPGGPVELDGSEPVHGDEDAPYLIVEFADYACGHCANASKDMERLLKKHDDVQVRFKAYPRTSECNPGFGASNGLGPCIAALAAECAHQQGLFWEANKQLFSNQEALKKSSWALLDVEFLMKEAGLDLNVYRTCFEDTTMMDSVIEEAIAGVNAKIEGTPTFYIQGVTPEGFVRVRTPIVDDVFTIIQAHRKGAVLPSPEGW